MTFTVPRVFHNILNSRSKLDPVLIGSFIPFFRQVQLSQTAKFEIGR